MINYQSLIPQPTRLQQDFVFPIPTTKARGSLKRNRGEAGKTSLQYATDQSISSRANATRRSAITHPPPQKRQKPTSSRGSNSSLKNINLDCLFIIISFMSPAQLLEMRSKIALCYRFLRDHTMLWKYSRHYHYGLDMPDPPSGLTEFQFAQLRHGRGCMSCGAPNTRKTYWAFLRRMCHLCLTSKVIKHHEAVSLLKGTNGQDLSFLCDSLHTGILDSWGNFIGVGLASKHARKTVYLRSDVLGIFTDYNTEYRKSVFDADKTPSWTAKWLAAKIKKVEERRTFAIKIEQWEKTQLLCKTSENSGRKSRRKHFYKEKASQLTPPINAEELEACPSYRRAITIPKEPNDISWGQLRAKIIRETMTNAANTSMQENYSCVPLEYQCWVYGCLQAAELPMSDTSKRL
jgi:hypothetical protein